MFGPLLIFISFLTIILYLSPKSTEHFVNSNQAMIPFHSPFHANFVRHDPKIYKIAINHRNKHEKELSKTIFPGDELHSHSNSHSNSDFNQLDLINEGQIDFGLVTEDTLHNAVFGIDQFKGKKHKNLRFVTMLFDNTVNIMVPNDLNIVNIMDIKKQKCTINVNVGNKNSEHHLSCLEVFEYLGISIGRGRDAELFFDSLDLTCTYGKKIKMIYRVSHHPDTTIKQLSRLVPSHFVGLKPISGYMFDRSPVSQKFFNLYRNYRRASHDTRELIPQIYQSLSNVDHQKLYIPTIYTPVVLVTHKKTENHKITEVLGRLSSFLRMQRQGPTALQFLKRKTIIELSDLSTPIPYHPGSLEFFKMNNIHVKGDNRDCIHYKHGHCPRTS